MLTKVVHFLLLTLAILAAPLRGDVSSPPRVEWTSGAEFSVSETLIAEVTEKSDGLYDLEIRDCVETWEVGVYATLFRQLDGLYTIYVGYLTATEQHTGNQFLAAVIETGKQLQVSSVFLFDAATVTDTEVVDGAYHRIFLRSFRIFVADTPEGWYESKGFAPMTEAEVKAWYQALEVVGPDEDILDEEEGNPSLFYSAAKKVVREVTMRELMEAVPFLTEAGYSTHANIILSLSGYGIDRTLHDVLAEVAATDRALLMQANRFLINWENSPICRILVEYVRDEEADSEVADCFALLSATLGSFVMEEYMDEEIKFEVAMEVVHGLLAGEEPDASDLELLEGFKWASAYVSLLQKIEEESEPDLRGDLIDDAMDFGVSGDLPLSDFFPSLRRIAKMPAGSMIDGAEGLLCEYIQSLPPEDCEEFWEGFWESKIPALLVQSFELLGKQGGGELWPLVQLELAKMVIGSQSYFVYHY